MAENAFEDARIADLYDAFENDRSDLDVYVAIVDELGARRVLDVGAGTGTLACMLAARGIDVIGLEPAAAMLSVARSKPAGERVRWIHGDATALTPLQVDGVGGVGRVDLALMTGNVAQVFVTDDEWATTLACVHRALRPGGWLAFETRIPERRAWERWNRRDSSVVVDVPAIGRLESWEDLIAVDGPLVTFRSTTVFPDGKAVVADSTLRFRSRAEIETSLTSAGFVTRDVRDAPDRADHEWVFFAQRAP